MPVLTVTSKGQVTLRRELLQHLGVQPGQKIALEKLQDGRIEMRADKQTGKISDVFGMLKSPKQRRLSIDEINEIVEQGWARKS
jgi:bifunctional DNA-binding transcriptional regulator/antitoxin component of YhaV-PrlF toxin-antitoxin module